MSKNSIIKTLKYFDLHNHPLTLLEVQRFLLSDGWAKRPRLDEIFNDLEDLIGEKVVVEENGFFALYGRQELFEKRYRAYPIYFARIFKTARVVKILRYVPFVRGIAVSGSLAGMYSNEQSDIDFLVIVRKNRIWLARLFLSAVTQALGVRRHGENISNRICLNHYVAEDCILENDRTTYSAVEYASLLCLFNPAVLDDFLKKQIWLGNFLVFPPCEVSRSVYTVKPSRILQPALEFLIDILGGNFWERLARCLQRKRIKTGETVLVSDNELSFHPGSKGRSFMARFENLG